MNDHQSAPLGTGTNKSLNSVVVSYLPQTNDIVNAG